MAAEPLDRSFKDQEDLPLHARAAQAVAPVAGMTAIVDPVALEHDRWKQLHRSYEPVRVGEGKSRIEAAGTHPYLPPQNQSGGMKRPVVVTSHVAQEILAGGENRLARTERPRLERLFDACLHRVDEARMHQTRG